MRISEAVVKRLYQLCDERNLTVNKISNISGVTQSTVSDIVNGTTTNAGIATIKKLCDGFEISVREFFDSDLFDDLEQHFQPDPLTAPMVLEAFKHYDEGATMKTVRDWLNLHGMKSNKGRPLNYNSVEYMLKNRRYIGEYKYREIVIPDGIPAIVPKDLFDRVQASMEKNRRAPARHKAEDDCLLTTKLFCGHCSALMFGECGWICRIGKTLTFPCMNGSLQKSTKPLRTC